MAEAVAAPGIRWRSVFLATTVLMYGFVLAGFWPYWSSAARWSTMPWVLHLHAAVFTGWMVLLLAQVLLVAGRRTDLHRRLGRVGMAWGVLVLVMGLVISAVMPALHVIRGEGTLDEQAAFLILPLGDMVLFGTLFGAAMYYRRKPEIHKRCILLATVALMFAPVARVMDTAGLPALLLVWLLPVLIGAAADWRSRGRVHAAYLIGAAWLLVGFGRLALMESPAWLRVGRSLVAGVQPAVGRLFD